MKVKVNKKKVGIIVFLIIVIFICGNALAALVGAPNVFFAIRDLVNDDVEVEGKDNLLTDRVENEVSTENVTEKQEEEKEEFEEKEIKTALQNYQELVAISEASPDGLLHKLNLMDDTDDYDEIDSENYVKTDIKFEEYKEACLEYMTEEWFEGASNFSKKYKVEDGNISYLNGGATGFEVVVESIRNKNDSNYIGVLYTINVDDSTNPNYELEFSVEEVDGKCVISYCDYEINYSVENEDEKLVPQLDGDFKSLEDAAVEHIEVRNDIVAVKEVSEEIYLNADMDNDDKIDEIKIIPDTDEYGLIRDFNIFINDEQVYESNESKLYRVLTDVYIVDLNEEDKYLDIVLYGDESSESYEYFIFTYDGEKLESKSQVLMGDCMYVDQNDKAIVQYGPVVESMPVVNSNYYSVSEDKLVDLSVEQLEDVIVEFKNVYFTEDLDNIQKVLDDWNEGFEKALEMHDVEELENVKAYVIDFENNKVKVKLEDGTEGYLFVAKGNFAG